MSDYQDEWASEIAGLEDRLAEAVTMLDRHVMDFGMKCDAPERCPCSDAVARRYLNDLHAIAGEQGPGRCAAAPLVVPDALVVELRSAAHADYRGPLPASNRLAARALELLGLEP